MAHIQEKTRVALNLSRLKTILQSALYPASKEELVVWAENEDAPPEVVDTLQHLSDRSYESPEDVGRELGLTETVTEGRRGVLSPMTQESEYAE